MFYVCCFISYVVILKCRKSPCGYYLNPINITLSQTADMRTHKLQQVLIEYSWYQFDKVGACIRSNSARGQYDIRSKQWCSPANELLGIEAICESDTNMFATDVQIYRARLSDNHPKILALQLMDGLLFNVSVTWQCRSSAIVGFTSEHGYWLSYWCTRSNIIQNIAHQRGNCVRLWILVIQGIHNKLEKRDQCTLCYIMWNPG